MHRCQRRFRPAVWLAGTLVAGCYEGLEEERDIAADVQRALDADQKRERCDQIKAAAAQRGITNPLVIAGVAHHESGLAQCWSELTWACQGPWSNDCGGPTMAGAGDGSCALQQGGLGMFQLDAGKYAETLAHYGEVTTVSGNTDAGIDTVIHKLSVCPSSKHTTSDPELVRNADGRLEVFVRGGDGALYHRWQVAPSDSWRGWVSLGGELASF